MLMWSESHQSLLGVIVGDGQDVATLCVGVRRHDTVIENRDISMLSGLRAVFASLFVIQILTGNVEDEHADNYEAETNSKDHRCKA